MDAGRSFATNTAWVQQQWQVAPSDLQLYEYNDGKGNDTAEHGSSSSSFANDSPEPTASSQPVVIDVAENDPARYRFHDALYAAAMRGAPDQVSSILREMEAEQLQPGAAAHHTLVFAHIKAGNAMEGLHTARESVKNGIAPLEETYVALVFGLVDQGFVESAEGVVLSMYNAGRDARNGASINVLFREPPTFFPCHGNAKHLRTAVELAQSMQDGWLSLRGCLEKV